MGLIFLLEPLRNCDTGGSSAATLDNERAVNAVNPYAKSYTSDAAINDSVANDASGNVERIEPKGDADRDGRGASSDFPVMLIARDIPSMYESTYGCSVMIDGIDDVDSDDAKFHYYTKVNAVR